MSSNEKVLTVDGQRILVQESSDQYGQFRNFRIADLGWGPANPNALATAEAKAALLSAFRAQIVEPGWCSGSRGDDAFDAALLEQTRGWGVLWARRTHPFRYRGPYTAEIVLSPSGSGPTAKFATIRKARAWAADHGALSDHCTITDRDGRVVGRHVRDTNGIRWIRTSI
jgi:hypothetical protein